MNAGLHQWSVPWVPGAQNPFPTTTASAAAGTHPGERAEAPALELSYTPWSPARRSPERQLTRVRSGGPGATLQAYKPEPEVYHSPRSCVHTVPRLTGKRKCGALWPRLVPSALPVLGSARQCLIWTWAILSRAEGCGVGVGVGRRYHGCRPNTLRFGLAVFLSLSFTELTFRR